MCDTSWPGVEALAGADDAAVVAAITWWTRAEAAASARRLEAVAELVRRRADGPTDCAHWSCDNWDAMAAEVGAAQGISHRMASSQMYLAVALRDRLPKVAALFAEGAISARLVSMIVWHTDLIKDAETMRLVDKTLAEDAARFGPLSATKTAQAIDAVVDYYDPGALRRTRDAARGREVVIDQTDGESGTAGLWGRLYATDAAILDRRLTQMAQDVCERDPRTLKQRRADALGALAAGTDRLACDCGDPDCVAGPGPDQRAESVMVHVIAEASAVSAQPDPQMSGEAAAEPRSEPAPPTAAPKKQPTALISTGGGMVPAPLLAELIRDGAQLRPIIHPGNRVEPEPGYRPSAALDRFVRCRDMNCRFPNCDQPAEFCDVDHTIPYPLGLTHPSNLKCLCRKHHLLKTFWTAWRDEQRPDGRVVWTSPSGQTYTTHPGSRLFFPSLCVPTGELLTPATAKPTALRGLMMPTRRRTRRQDRASRIDAERALNAAHVAERNKPPPF
ncbi:hypothetical protein A5791_02795 [Mycobacterium sp. 852002-51163_SCH5372311]|uniref:HNH endonuclease signature motif containing protein n=1 Tax=Mycobacterium sp. 852002-51163_SCH5372311 TaxID=1834097 RepID=UPI0007FB9EB5|nr:HNH endonuclease signature motif containing protein [Mycobacterium sp. 852002-51163_SCH5372311]OBF83756.1 hypothetical protein A5791_02795 [Mycobacterium sp. 852002-51163_SCH5372311]